MNLSPVGGQASDTPRQQPSPRDVRWRPYQRTRTMPVRQVNGRDMSMFDALAVWAAVDYQANRARLTEKQSRALRAVFNQTVRYQRLRVPVSRDRLSRLSDIHPNSIGAVLTDLASLGFIDYAPGKGAKKSSVRVLIPEGWQEHEQDLGTEEGEVATPAASPSPGVVAATATTKPEVEVASATTTDVADTATGVVAINATSNVAATATQTGSPYVKESRRQGGVAVLPVALNAIDGSSPCAPTPEAVCDAFLQAMRGDGRPVIGRAAVLAQCHEAMKAGYSARAVLIGLGMWDREGYRLAKQITEWVEKAASIGAEPAEAMPVADLLAEGARRYLLWHGRRPSRSEARRAQSAAAVREFSRGAQ